MSNKKQRFDANSSTTTASSGEKSDSVPDYGLNLESLQGFAVQRVLHVSAETVSLLGTFNSEQKETMEIATQEGKEGAATGDTEVQEKPVTEEEAAVVLLRRKKLCEDDVPALCSISNALTLDVQNTYYGFYKSAVSNIPQCFDVTVIHPAKPWHIAKYSKQESIVFQETPELYKKITEPYIDSHPASEIKWLYQILQKEKEQERLLFEDPDSETGFMFTAFEPAEKCITQTKTMPDNFYSLVLVNKRDLPSIRSLSTAHLPLLKNIRDKVYKYAKETLLVDSHKLRLFFHYKPSYFHLHVHVVHVNHEMHIHLKDYLLDDVIQNIELSPTYYQKQTLSYTLGTNDALYKSYQDHMGTSTGSI